MLGNVETTALAISGAISSSNLWKRDWDEGWRFCTRMSEEHVVWPGDGTPRALAGF